MKERHTLGARQDDVADPGKDIRRDVICHAVFQDLIARVGMKTAQKRSLRSLKHLVDAGLLFLLGGGAVKNIARRNHPGHAEMRFHPVLVDQPVYAVHLIIDDDGASGRVCVKIPLMAEIRPQNDHPFLRRQNKQQHGDIGKSCHQNPDDDIDQEIRDHRCQ